MATIRERRRYRGTQTPLSLHASPTYDTMTKIPLMPDAQMDMVTGRNRVMDTTLMRPRTEMFTEPFYETAKVLRDDKPLTSRSVFVDQLMLDMFPFFKHVYTNLNVVGSRTVVTLKGSISSLASSQEFELKMPMFAKGPVPTWSLRFGLAVLAFVILLKAKRTSEIDAVLSEERPHRRVALTFAELLAEDTGNLTAIRQAYRQLPQGSGSKRKVDQFFESHFPDFFATCVEKEEIKALFARVCDSKLKKIREKLSFTYVPFDPQGQLQGPHGVPPPRPPAYEPLKPEPSYVPFEAPERPASGNPYAMNQ